MYQKIAAAALILAGLVLASSGTYLLVMKGSDGADAGGSQLLAHVPADTVFYSGYTDPSLPVTQLTSVWGQFQGMADASKLAEPGAAAREGGAGLGMLAGLYNHYLDSLGADGRLLARFGLDPSKGIGAYAVGALPVLRIGATDTERFWQQIGDIETSVGVDAEAGQQRAARSRRYAFDTGASSGELALMIATHDGDAVITLAGSGISDEALALALGETTPESSLAETGRPQRLAKQHGTLPGATGFIDHRALVAGLTGKDGNRFAAMVSQLSSAWGGGEAMLAFAQTPACRADARAIAERWPHTAIGLSAVDNGEQRFDSRLAVAVADDDLLATLRELRGHIPQPVDRQPLFGLGVGLNIPGAASAVQKLSQRFTDADFECPALKQAQQQLANQPTGRLGMMTSMLGDVRGVGLAVTALERGQAGPSPVTGDAVLEIAAPEPRALWQFAQSSLGISPSNAPEPGGEPVPVEVPMVPVSLRAALRDNALMVLAGDAELDGAAGESDVEPNGIMQVSYDYSRLAESLRATGAARMGGSEAMETLRAVEDFDVRYDTRLDITNSDLRLDLRVTAEDS